MYKLHLGMGARESRNGKVCEFLGKLRDGMWNLLIGGVVAWREEQAAVVLEAAHELEV